MFFYAKKAGKILYINELGDELEGQGKAKRCTQEAIQQWELKEKQIILYVLLYIISEYIF